MKSTEVCIKTRSPPASLPIQGQLTKNTTVKWVIDSKCAFLWGRSSCSYSGLGITEYTEFQFRKERSQIWKRNTHGGGDLRTTMSAHALDCQRTLWRRISRQKIPKRTPILCIPSKPYSFYSVHSAIGSRMNGLIFRSFRKRNSSQKNTNTIYSEYSYSQKNAP